MAGTRANTAVDDPTTLQTQLIVNGIQTEPFSFDKVEIYPTYEDAQAETNIIETIPAIDITTDGNGRSTVLAGDPAGFPLPKTYFDKTFFTLINGGSQQSQILNFIVHIASSGSVPPGPKETALITLNLCHITALPMKNEKVEISMCSSRYAKYGNNLVGREPERFMADENGIVTFI
jgi:hypothetical protein